MIEFVLFIIIYNDKHQSTPDCHASGADTPPGFCHVCGVGRFISRCVDVAGV